jgi:hypothetical protein
MSEDALKEDSLVFDSQEDDSADEDSSEGNLKQDISDAEQISVKQDNGKNWWDSDTQ